MPSTVVSFIGSKLVALGSALGAASASAQVALAVGAAAVVAGAVVAKKLIENLYAVPNIDSDRSRQATVRGTVEPQKLIYGEALVSGPISFVGVSGDQNRDLYHAIVLAGHKCTDVTDIYFDDKVIADSAIDINGNVTTGDFGPKDGTTIVNIKRYLGSQTSADAGLDNAFNSISSSEHVGLNLTYLVTKFTLTDASQETWDKYMPTDIKGLVKGKKIYDPRQDSTSSLYDANVGVGTCRVDNESTWVFSDNPVWCLVDYLRDDYFGMGIDVSRIDLSKAVDAANVCDTLVTIPNSQQEKRFTCNGVLFGTSTHKSNINKILSSMNGMLTYTNGKFVIRAGAFEAVGTGLTLSDDNLIGPARLKTSFERNERFNTITGTFIDPSKNYKEIEFPKVQITSALTRDNNEELSNEIKLSMTNSLYMAQRIAHKLIQQSDLQKVLTFPTNLAGMNIAVGDRVSVTLSEFGYSNKTFVCLGWTLSESGSGGVNLTLREDDSASYADMASSSYSTVTPNGGISEGFSGVPDPSGLSATAHVESIELDWTNPANMTGIIAIEVFASPNSSWSSAVKIGETLGTQFIHDESNGVDSISEGDQRYYWVRARRFPSGEGSDAVSDRNPDSDTSTVQATKGALGALANQDTVGDGQIDDNAVGTDQIEDGAVDTDQIADDAVTIDKVANTLESTNYVANTSGWRLTTAGDFEAGDGTFRGAVTATSGSFGGTTIASSKIYQGTGTWANSNTGFYLDNTGKFSLKDKLFFSPTDSRLTVSGNITADTITVNDQLVVLGPLEAKSLAAGTITREMLSQDVLDEIFGALATSVGGSNGDYKEGTGSFTTSGGTVTLGTSSDKFDHGTADVDVEFIVDHFFYSTTNYTTAQAQATLNFEVSADGTFTDLTSATKTHTLQFNEYDLSSYYGYTYLVYYLTGDVTKTFTSGSGNDIPDDTDLQFRVRVTGVGTAFTSQTVPFTLEANEGVTGVVSTGGNADTLDNLDSTAFLRSNTNDTFDGDLTITGQLILQGSIDQYNVTDLDVTDKTITVNSGNTQSLSDGAGLIVDRGTAADASITWDETDERFEFSHPVYVSGQSLFVGTSTANNEYAAQFQNSAGTTILRARNDGRVLIPSGYLYAQHSEGIYSTGSIKARGGITNDGGNNLSISSGGTDITFNSKNFTSVGTISSGAITSSGTIHTTSGNFRNGNYSAGGYETNLGANALTFKRDGTSYIDQAGTGNLAFRFGSSYTTGLTLSSSSATFAGTISSGAITSSGNMSLTGSLDITKSGSTHSLVLGTLDDLVNPSADAYIWATTGNGTFKNGQGAHLVFEGRTASRNFYFKVGNVTAPQHIMHHSGYVGIGTGDITPSQLLHLKTTGSDARILSDASAGTMYIGQSSNADLWSTANTNMRFATNNTLRMQLTSGGVFTIGTTSTTPGFSTGNGHAFHTGDASHISRNGGVALVVNRAGSNGDVIQIRRDGSDVGGLRVAGGANLAINSKGSGGYGRLQDNGSDVAIWWTNGFYPATDNTKNLGVSNGSGRWKNLFMANGIYMGASQIVDASRNLVNINTISSGQVSTSYGVKFTNGATDFLLYNNTNDNLLYMRDQTNGAMLQTWHTNKVQMNKPLDIGTRLHLLESGSNAEIKNDSGVLYLKSDEFSFQSAGGTGRVQVYGSSGYTLFTGLDLAISNVNSSHGHNTYFRGNTTHFVLGMTNGNTFYCNYGNTSGQFRLYGNDFYYNNTVIFDSSRNLKNVPVIYGTAGNTAIELNHSAYTMLSNPEGARCLYLGDSGDRGNYYDNNTHYFRNSSGATVWTTIGSAGMQVSAVNNTYNFRAYGQDGDSFFGVYDDANNSANIVLTRSDGATIFRVMGHTGATTIAGTLSSETINIGSGHSLQSNGTTVIDSSRNLTNIGYGLFNGYIQIQNSSSQFDALDLGSSTQSGYTNVFWRTNSGTAQVWKSGTGYTSYGGASAFNIYNSNGLIAFHPSAQNNVAQIDSGGLVLGNTKTIELKDDNGSVRGTLQARSSAPHFRISTSGNEQIGFYDGTTENIRINGSGDLNLKTGSLEINGTGVIDTSRQIVNSVIASSTKINPTVSYNDGQDGGSLNTHEAMYTTHGLGDPLNSGLQFNTALFKNVTMYTRSGSTWTNQGVQGNLTDGNCANRFGGTTLSNGVDEVILSFGSNLGYTFISSVTIPHTTAGHSMRIYIETSESGGDTDTGWTQVWDTGTGISSWPGSTTITKSFGVGGGYDDKLRVRIVPSWNSSYPNNNIVIGQIVLRAGYGPANKLFEWDSDKRVALNGPLRIGNQDVLTTSRNLTNIASLTTTGLVSANNYQVLGTVIFDSSRVLQNFYFKTNTWLASQEGKGRLYFESSGRTFYGASTGHQFRDSGDTTRCNINNSGGINLLSGGDTQAPAGTALAVGGTEVIDQSRNVSPQRVENGDGTSVKPSYSFASDGDTGFYRSASNTMAFLAGGSQKLVINASGLSISNGTLSIAGTNVIDGSRNGSFANITNTNGAKIEIQGGTDGGNGRGIFIWDASDSNWGIYMATAGSGKSLAGGTATAALDGGTQHHIRFRCYNQSSRGWIFENSSEQARASINANTGNFLTVGNVTAYASDERLKENITPIADPIEKIKRLQGVEFDWKSDCEDKGFIPSFSHETGVIAQNIAEVVPDAVSPAPFDNDYLTVDKSKLVAVLIEAVKAQQETIESLTKRIEELENGDN